MPILIHTKREARDLEREPRFGGRLAILIHTKREARDGVHRQRPRRAPILIHTKREARDRVGSVPKCSLLYFNPHEARSS